MNRSATRSHPTLEAALIGAVAGLAGAWVKAQAEPPLQKLTEAYFPPTPGQKKMTGADPIGRQDHMPPAEMIQAAADATDHDITKKQKLAAQQAVHYAMGAALGAAYGVLAARDRRVSRGLGVPAGAVMYGLTHATAVPATGFQAWPWQLPLAAVLWEAGSHLAFGATTEVTRRGLSAGLDRARRG